MRDDDEAGERRKFLRRWGVLPIALALPAWRSNAAEVQELTPTPACSEDEEPTPRQMEGPFFKPRSPQRVSLLAAGLQGTTILVSGLVLSTRCKPVVGAASGFLAVRRPRRVRQQRLPAARSPVHRQRRKLSSGNHRTGRLPRSHTPHPRQGPSAGATGADDPALLSRRAGKPARFSVPAGTAADDDGCRRRQGRPLRLCAEGLGHHVSQGASAHRPGRLTR